jgi:hypothetical protein
VVETPMKKTIYIKYDVASESYEDAVKKLEAVNKILETKLENGEELEIFKTRKIVTKVHM